MINRLMDGLPTHPLVIPLSPHTSQDFLHHRRLRPWKRDELVTTIKNICLKWGFWVGETGEGGVSMMSHSNGSVAHGWSTRISYPPCPTSYHDTNQGFSTQGLSQSGEEEHIH